MYQKIKEKYQELRKEGTQKVWISLLSTIIGDIQKIEKDKGSVSDDQIFALLKKYKENATQNVEYNVPNAKEELHILEGMLPKQLTGDEIEYIIDSFVAKHKPTNMGQIMAYMKTNYSGLYDAKIASVMAKSKV